MNLDDIQPNLLALLVAMPALEDVEDHLLIDDGDQNAVMEASLTEQGLSILIMPPQCTGVINQGQGVASMAYVSTIWVRTNPKIKVSSVVKWNPLTLEKLIIPAVLAYGMAPTNYFQIPEGLEPETDFTDTGNNSRLIRFSTNVILQ